MTWLSVGTLALPTLLRRENATLQARMNELGVALASGEVAKPQRSLRGDVAALQRVDSRLSILTPLTRAISETATGLRLMQDALDRIGSARSALTATLLSVDAASNKAGVTAARDAAAGALDDILASLSVQSSGRFLFSGQTSEQTPLVGADQMIAALVTRAAGATSALDVASAIDAAMNDSGDLFDTTFYLGGPEAEGALIDSGTRHGKAPTTADPAIRTLLAGVTLAAMANDPGLALPDGERAGLIRLAAERLLGNAPLLAQLQGRVGVIEESLERAALRFASERNALEEARSGMIGADPFETAAQLTETQTQLESLYALTARTSRLSLTAFLR